MRPLGPIPPGFPIVDGRLLIAGHPASHWVEAAGDTPLFVYDGAMIAARVATLRAHMPAALAVHYAVKANPLPALVAAMADQVDGFDIASAGELSLVSGAGIAAERISFAGPGKRDDALAAAIDAGITLNLESTGEATRALAIAGRAGRRPRLAVRVNPDFELKGSGMKMGGGARPFGVDTAAAPALIRAIVAAGADYRGLHIYAGSQALDAGAIIASQAATVALAARLSDAAGIAPPVVNLGGGFGIPYVAGDGQLDIAAVGAALGDTLARRPAILAGTRFAIELGRWLVGEAGVYLARVVDVKDSDGVRFVVIDGGLHHQLAASGNFGAVVRRNYPLALPERMGEAALTEQNVVGCLCTPLDRMADQAMLPPARVGDLVAMFCAGAYGASASPDRFLGHGPAHELFVPSATA